MQEMAFWKFRLAVSVVGVSLLTVPAMAQSETPNATPSPSIIPPTAALTNVAPGKAPAATPTDADLDQGPPPGSDAKSYVAWGITNGARGRLDAAIAAFSQAIKLDPKYAPAYYNQGFAFALQNRSDEAIADFNQTIALAPKFRDAYYQRGSLYGQRGDFDLASKDFQQVSKIDPNYAPARYNWGHVLYFRGDLEGSLTAINDAIRLNANFPYTYFIRGLIRNVQGHPLEAISDFQKSFGLGYPTAAFWVWIIQSENGQGDTARQDLAVAAKTDKFKPNEWPTPLTDFLLGKMTESDMVAKAKADNEADTKQQTCQAWFYAGMAKHIAGDESGARADLAKALATGSTASEEYIEAQRYLSTKKQ